MGRIAPKKSKAPGYDALFSRAVWSRLRASLSRPALRLRPDDLRRGWQWSRAALSALWHLPERFAWMSPLPAFHRRGIVAAATLLLLALLWPTTDPAPSAFPAEPHVDSVPMQAELQDATLPPEQATWQAYLIQPGQTLAQLLRDHNLDVTDAFAMARVEGEARPLSNLKAGQHVLIRHNAQGQIQALKIETTTNQQVTFQRTRDGRFTRLR
ncbi:cell envelope opacity-associated protein A [Edwardsiella hoshinae]|uniref:Cell envelope opacity-associated protein A n=1 Tax=Edwardsiella hoshinae TaxID=93378 RepID=A0ABM6EM19_9GAMM|nr:LysM-like peptidoglycan-binding domain-containing protein [Edwardsiella hoshinae]AOV98101.1 cell envelope opacity-associated protein A [Edwardsiella hoshinae]